MAPGRRPAFPLRRLPPRTAAAILLLVAAAVVGVWQVYQHSRSSGRLIAAGSIEATPIDVTTRVAGRVLRLAAREGEEVKAGTVLAELAPQASNARVAQARAAVSQAGANLAQAEQAVTAQAQMTDAQVAQAEAQMAAAAAGVPQAQTALAIQERTGQQAVLGAEAQLGAADGRVRSAQSALTKARDDLARQRALFAQGAVAASQVDAAQAAYDAAVAQDRSAREAVTQARANLAAAQANLRQVEIQQQAVAAARAQVAQAQAGVRNAQSGYSVIAQRRHDLAAAQAALAQARANLNYSEVIAGHDTITAPLDGLVQSKNVEEGEVVPAGAALYTMIDPRDVWIRVYIREDRIGRVKIGQPARVTVDMLPGQAFTGRVTEINTHPEFTTVNVQTKEDRVKLVFGVKIRLDDPEYRLKPGMPGHVDIAVTGSWAAAAGRAA